MWILIQQKNLVVSKYIVCWSYLLKKSTPQLKNSSFEATPMQIIQQCGPILGDTLANVVNFMDRDLVLLGGTVSNVVPGFLAAIRRSILAHSPSFAA